MRCKDCDCCEQGFFRSRPTSYVCTGVKHPFVIENINEECTEYPEKNEKLKHKYLYELFPDVDHVPFPFGEKDYAPFDERDTFNMDMTLIVWLYERLRYFQDEASKMIDLTYYKFSIDGEKLTQRECIDRMVTDCKTILLDDDVTEKTWRTTEDLFKILSKVYWTMWW